MSLEFELPLVSMIFICMLMVVYFVKRKINLVENNMYVVILWSSLITSLIDTGCHIICALNDFETITVEYYLLFNYLNKIMSIFFIVIFSCLLAYTMLISYKSIREKPKKIFLPLLVYNFFYFFIVQFTNIELFRVGNVTNVRGSTIKAAYLFVAILLIITIILTILNFKKKDKRYYAIFFISLVLGFSYIFTVFLPGMIIYDLALTLLCYIMYFTIENPDVKMVEQLELARDAADKANAAKTDFLSSMSHEIRTPLNAIVGFSDCIKHSDNLDEAKENADDIINASNTLLEIVNGILDISKIEAGKLEIVNSDYNAPKLFNGLAKLISPKMREKGLDFQVVIAEDLPPTLYGDPANVKKVVTNLLSNAYKYTDKGFVRFEVKCVNNNGICRLIISVEDSGRGIKKESVEKLFTKFQRVEEDKNTTIEGTGLGLAITKQLVELMGGNVVVSSVYGEGSKFILTLDQRIDNVVVEEEKEVADTIDLTGKKLLIVDDNMVNLKVASKLFARYNAEVEVCDSGFKCIELIEKGNRYDLILMDDMMPKMSGTETFKKLKNSSNFNIPVVALTANAITGMREKYLNEGFTDYLAKPIEKEAMIEAFNKIFNNGVVSKSIETVEEINFNKDFLEANGVDVNHGLELLGDISLYNDTMSDFLTEIDNRLPLLAEYKNNSDMENYTIIVHAIKSDCKYLGIMSLADLAYEHELKSKDNDVEYVNNNYDNLIDMIGDYVTICKKYLGRD